MPDSSTVDAGAPGTVGLHNAASEDTSYASLVETELSVCSQVDVFDGAPVEGVQGTRSMYVRVRCRLARFYATVKKQIHRHTHIEREMSVRTDAVLSCMRSQSTRRVRETYPMNAAQTLSQSSIASSFRGALTALLKVAPISAVASCIRCCAALPLRLSPDVSTSPDHCCAAARNFAAATQAPSNVSS